MPSMPLAMVLAAVMTPRAQAASLDNLEVGGPWGTPTSTDATAGWWNPAGWAGQQGTRFMIEGAPTFATVTYTRTDDREGERFSGTDIYELSGIVPFAGIASDLTVKNLGVGAALALPFVRGGNESEPGGVGRYALRSGDTKGIYLLMGGAYDLLDYVSVGAAFAIVQATWTADVDSDTLPDIRAMKESEGIETNYTADDLEQQDYTTNLKFGELSSTTTSFSVGVRATPIPLLAIGVAYVNGARAENTGDVTVTFDCPPDDDAAGGFGAEAMGMCYDAIPAKASIGYTLPARVHAGIAFLPDDRAKIEIMGGYVWWGAYTDFDITISEAQAESEEAAELIDTEVPWARANEDSYWFGVDAKGTLLDGRVTFGGRVLYDKAAIPDHALSANNWDADELIVGVLGAFKPLPALELGLSYSHHFAAPRTVDDSGFGMTVDGEKGRWFYPHANGTYEGSVDRIGLQVRSEFGNRFDKKKKDRGRRGGEI
jgi:long-chain fatty acid transport protein